MKRNLFLILVLVGTLIGSAFWYLSSPRGFWPSVQAAETVSTTTVRAGTGGVLAGRFVKFQSDGIVIKTTDPSDKIVGICERDANADGVTQYAPVGTVTYLASGGAIVAGDLLTTDGNAKGVSLPPTGSTYGRVGALALTSDAEGTHQVLAIVVANYLSPSGSLVAGLAAKQGTLLTHDYIFSGDPNNKAAGVPVGGDVANSGGTMTIANGAVDANKVKDGESLRVGLAVPTNGTVSFGTTMMIYDGNNLIMTLPTSDPNVAGAPWKDANGFIRVSPGG
jgi:hypothetical protein